MPSKSKYSDWSKEDLIKRVDALEKRKKYGLVWDEERTKEKFEAVAEGKLPVLKEVKSKEINTDPEKPTHILIEGDNYHALSVLNYTHEKAVDVLYFDPPYNTGAKDWKYNNDYVDRNDQWRHSKWISMMYKRLLIAKRLLKNNGVLLVAIDDHEVHNLRHILNDIMGENNYIATICIEVNPAGQNIRDNSPAISHDYCLIYARKIDEAVIIPRALTADEAKSFKEKDDKGYYLWDNLRRRGGNSTPKDRPGQWFPLFVNKATGKISLSNFSGAVKIWPIDPKGTKRIWRVNPDGFLREFEEGNISIIEKAKRIEIVKKSYLPEGRLPKTLWKDGKYSATSYGTKLLLDVLGKNVFNYPKSLYLVLDCLKYWAKPDSVVLDFFAGSGTTGHAVLELNKIDNGNRKFILCTNNENNICTDVCYPRIQKVIKGYKNSSGKKIDGLSGNLKYFKTSFAPSAPTDKNKELLTKESVEMLCLRENTFDFVSETDTYKIFKNNEHYTGIIFDQLSIPKFKKEASKLNKSVSVYVFSLGDDDFSEEFADLKNKIKVCSIPEAILRVYRRIFKS
jgi:Adenine specific DNA methylase Mod